MSTSLQTDLASLQLNDYVSRMYNYNGQFIDLTNPASCDDHGSRI